MKNKIVLVLSFCGISAFDMQKKRKLGDLHLYKCDKCGVYNRFPRRTYEECLRYLDISNPSKDEIKKTYEKYFSIIEKIEKYDSIYLASKWIFEQGLSENIHSIKSSISCSIRGIYKSSFGFKWELDKDEDLENEIEKAKKK